MLSVEGEAGLRDLDDENGVRGMGQSAGSRITGHDGEVRLWLGLCLERDRELHPHARRRPERPLKGAVRELDGDGMAAALRLADHELPAQELETLVGSKAPASDELVILGPGPGAVVDGIRRHEGRLSSTDRSVNVPSPIRHATRPDASATRALTPVVRVTTLG